jgi:PAS domain S-box-containing protein
MSSATYSFLDVAVLDAVREHLAAGDAVVILSTNLSEVIWANGPGAALFGYDDVEEIAGTESGLPFAARRQITSTRGYPHIGENRALVVRLKQDFAGTSFLASAISLPDGENALMLVARIADESTAAMRAISGFVAPGLAVALLGSDGAIEVASKDFAALDIGAGVLAALVTEVSGERDRLVKRIIDTGSARLPAGVARLTDNPARHLLLVVNEDQADDQDLLAEPQAHGVSDRTAPAHAPASEPHRDWPFMDDQPAAAPLDAPVAYETSVPTFGDAGDEQSVARPEIAERETEQVKAGISPELSPVGSNGAGKPSEAIRAASAENEVGVAEIDRLAPPIRFVWKTDAAGRFSDISREFVEAVGLKLGDLLGRQFAQVSDLLKLDPSQEIAGLLERRDTWSGRSVFWPIAGLDRKVPVDLAALPIYSRDRSFEGFRGFGVARLADMIVDPTVAALSLDPPAEPVAEAATSAEVAPSTAAKQEVVRAIDGLPAEASPTEGELRSGSALDARRDEAPAIAATPQPDRRASDKVIRLAEHRQPAPERSLSNVERSAFREIGERLKSDIGEVGPGTANAENTAGARAAAETAENDPPRGQGSGAPEVSDERSETLEVAEEITSGDFDAMQRLDGPSEATAGNAQVSSGEGEATPDARVTPAAAARAAIAQLKTSGFLPSAFSPPAETASIAQDTPILARLPVPVLIHAGDVLHYANEEFLKLTGYGSVEQLADAGGLDALFAETYENSRGEDADHRLRLRTAFGDEFAIDALLRSVPWRDGHALMLVVRRADEIGDAGEEPPRGNQVETETLKARVAEMRTIIDTATDGVILIDPDGMIRSISRPAEALFGFDSDDLVGKAFSSLFAIESQRAARDYLNGLSDHGVASVLNDGREVIGREAQGRFIPLFMTIGKLPENGGYCAVVRDITQWKRAEEELTEARSLAERASSHKSEFLARISHEIRTPLNAIIGFSELMIGERFGPVGNDRYRDYLQDINRSGNHVLELVNDLLDISKIEAGEQEMAHEAVSLNEALAQTVAMMQPQANRERVIIRSSFASKLPEVVADPRSIRQIALNLLSNAVRFTQAGGQVIVSTAYEPSGDVVMRVRDTGIGMTQAEIEQALKPFKQVNTLKRPRGDGTGLGLPLTKAMVEANRARFAIHSTPGEGTLVEISFPSTRVLAN